MNRSHCLQRIGLLPGLLAIALLVACGGDSAPATTSTSPASAQQSAAAGEDIPVEALPDPLPPPYLFQDEVTVEQAPITETTYVVQPGDSLAAIATRFCITVAEIQRLNTIVDVNTLDIGDELRIPIREGGCGAAAPESVTAEEPADEGPARPPGEIYVVQAGDTLADVAFTFGFTWVDLMNYNNLTEAQAGNLQIDQVLIIPPQPEQSEADVEAEEAEQQSGPSEPPG